MALLTKSGINKILKRVMETGGLELEEDITRLQSDFEEREGLLKNYGTVPEDEAIEEYEYAPKPPVIEPNEYEGKYNDLKKKYTDRFFSGGTPEAEEEHEEESHVGEEDINSLFKKVEE